MISRPSEFKAMKDDIFYLLDSWGRGCDHKSYEMDVAWLKTELNLWYLSLKELEENDSIKTS